MELKNVYSITQSQHGNWYVLKNGKELGDTPKFSTKAAAIRDALDTVSRDPANREYRETF
jgi:hypothetical protein